jgi:predicted site-specific integrase-resolvase
MIEERMIIKAYAECACAPHGEKWRAKYVWAETFGVSVSTLGRWFKKLIAPDRETNTGTRLMLKEALIALAYNECERAPHGGKSRVNAEWAKVFGIRPGTLKKWFANRRLSEKGTVANRGRMKS